MTSAVAAALARIGERDPALHAFTEVRHEEALAEERAARGLPLAGLPFAVKGPAGLRSYAARRLVAAGAVPVGTTSVPGPGTPWQTWGQGAHGRTVNPWRADRTPGGSSAGSAVAVAAGMVELATGSDGAGSVRIPAAWCGVFGLRTTAGLLPSPDRTGLASPGVLASSAARAETYLRHVLDGYAPRPPRLPVPAAYSPDLGFASVEPEVAGVTRAAVDRLVAAGVIRLVQDPVTLLDPADAWTAVRGGSPTPATRALRAAGDRALDAFFGRTPLLLTPVTPNPPHGHEGPGNVYSTALTWAFNLSGHPAASVPAGFTPDGCPTGLQLVTARGTDAELLGIACAVECVLPPPGPPRPPG
ncbi:MULTISPECIES: amidase family protein [Streptomyces]|uniref:Amidase family protein n=1 Tax=Streptomyces silvae TaxID=2803812 RepID=A0ABU8A7D4_9ACTN|nr:MULTISPECIES: amidase family protein [unclassified Streptomyces]MDX3324572.1 amidase family protein [Streptomyces sp. ME02-6979-3A]MDX3682956.1 amidase family protein [Streptomyces sp. AK04-4c]WSS71204.1 amidase family protein [Streptomyces sp. NBC_01175]